MLTLDAKGWCLAAGLPFLVAAWTRPSPHYQRTSVAWIASSSWGAVLRIFLSGGFLDLTAQQMPVA